jgi:hypothetical protein
MTAPIRVAVIGLGHLGSTMGKLLPYRDDFLWVAAADETGFLYNPSGLSMRFDESLGPSLTPHSDAALELVKQYGHEIDAIFLALPNTPINFYANMMRRILCETGFEGVIVDALKRSESIERLLNLDEDFRNRKLLYVTGTGMVPGLLTNIASIAALTFIEVLDINIHLGIQTPHNENAFDTSGPYIHVEGYEAKRLATLSAEEMALELENDDHLMSYSNREYADDIILELSGVCPRDRIRVSGLLLNNTEHSIPSTVTITGRTMTGTVTSHRLTLSSATNMVENACGSALGFMLRGIELYQRSFVGLMTSSDILPRFSRQNFAISQPKLHREKVEVLL